VRVLGELDDAGGGGLLRGTRHQWAQVTLFHLAQYRRGLMDSGSLLYEVKKPRDEVKKPREIPVAFPC